jgi:hypothetical protein
VPLPGQLGKATLNCDELQTRGHVLELRKHALRDA